MTCKIAVCDDCGTDRSYIEDLTRKWAAAAGHTVQLLSFPSGESFLFRYAQEKDFDILLLDIEMNAVDGVTVAKRIRRDNESVQIIFITGYSEYISEGYEVAALHYLMKPIKEEKLFSVLDRAVRKLSKNERCLHLAQGSETFLLPLYQIRYADVQQNYVTVHAREDITVRMTLGYLQEHLDERFYRVGRSAIVNLSCIRRVTKTQIILSDGTELPLPRGAYEGINRAIINMG